MRSLALVCGDVGVAEELAQEALVRACDRWERVRGMAAPGAWVHRVALNLSRSWYRRRQAEQRARTRHGPVADACSNPDLADVLAIRDAIAGLPPAQRSVLALRYYLRMSVAETAEVLGSSQGAVKQHSSRAVAALRSRFVEAQTPAAAPTASQAIDEEEPHA